MTNAAAIATFISAHSLSAPNESLSGRKAKKNKKNKKTNRTKKNKRKSPAKVIAKNERSEARPKNKAQPIKEDRPTEVAASITVTAETPAVDAKLLVVDKSAGAWGTRGGATLGGSNGVRFRLGGGGGVSRYDNFGLEGFYILGLSEDMDLGVGGRIPVWPFGVSPGVNLRYRLLRHGKLQLALDASAFVSFNFAPIFLFQVRLEPGVMASFFIQDNLELFFGLIIPVSAGWYSNGFAEGTVIEVAADARLGLAYTLEEHDIGLFAQADLMPGLSVTKGTYGNFGFSITAGVQGRF
jgi:hypothetical protein